MPTLTVVNENGEFEEVEVASKSVAFELEGGTVFKPAVVDRIEFDHSGSMSQIQHGNCNHTENRREGDEKPDITLEGICTESQIETLKSLKSQRELTLISDLFSGDVVVKRLTIEQNTEIINFAPNGEEPRLAFEFHLQVKQGLPNSQGPALNYENTVFAVADDILEGDS